MGCIEAEAHAESSVCVCIRRLLKWRSNVGLKKGATIKLPVSTVKYDACSCIPTHSRCSSGATGCGNKTAAPSDPVVERDDLSGK